jgi:uncharacterized membrane protein
MSELPLVPLIGLGLLFFASPLIVLVLVLALLSLRSRVRRLEARLAELEPRMGARASVPAEPVAAATRAAESPATPLGASGSPGVGPASAAPLQPVPEAVVEAAAPAGVERGHDTATGAPPRGAGAPTPRPSVGVGQWEGWFGGTWLSRVGGILLILGVGFFFKHAFEHEWVGPGGRVLAGLAAGLAMMTGGARLARRERYRVPAQSLIAVGISVLYLALYAAHALYALVGAPTTLAAMAAVTVVGFATALRLDAPALAALATLGGLLTPVVLDTDVDRATALFVYLAVLDAGVLLAASRRGWPWVVLIAFAGTQALYWTWLDRWYTDQLPVALGWATAFFLGFARWGLRGARVPPPADAAQLARTLLVLATPALYFAAARRVLDDPSGRRLALLALGLAALYLVAARWAARSPRGGPRLALFHRTVAIAFLALAPAVTLGRHELVVAWSVVGLVILCGGFVLGEPRLRAAGLGVSALAWGRWFSALGEDNGGAGAFLLAHPALPATVAVAITAALGALVYRARERAEAPAEGWERAVRPILLLVAVGSVALLITVELGRFRTLAIPPPYVPVVQSVVWMLAAMTLLALARGDRTRVLLGVATILLLALVGEALGGTDRWARIQDSLRAPLWNPRFLAGCLLAVLVWLYGQVTGSLPYLGERTRQRLVAVGSGGAALLLLWNLSVEVALMPLPETRFEPAKLRMASLSVLWALYAFTAMAWGLWRDRASLRVGAIVLFSITVLKVLVVDLAGLDALYRILSVVILGTTLLVASFLYARSRRRPGETA